MVQKNQKKHKFMKSSILQYSSFKESSSEKEKLVSTTTSPRSYKSAKFLAGKKDLSKTLGDPQKRSENFQISKQKSFSESQIFSKTLKGSSSTSSKNSISIQQKKKGRFPILPKISEKVEMKKVFPCLFVDSLEKKNEVLGTPLMNRLIRFLTKKGKKSKASLLFTKACTLLARFEAEKIDSQELSFSENMKKELEKKILNSQTYKSRKLSKFLSRGMKKSTFFEKDFKKKSLMNPEFFALSSNILVEQAVSSVKPFVEVKKVRVAGTTYQVPAILEKDRQENFALKWILQSAFERQKKNPSQGLEYSLAFEIYEASKKQGQARQKRNELHKLAETHRAFAHFRWW
jgi:small subunit ribosomal protein S7